MLESQREVLDLPFISGVGGGFIEMIPLEVRSVWYVKGGWRT